MLKALFLDMDETLCDTTAANRRAQQLLGDKVNALYQGADGQVFASAYVTGIYREWTDAQRQRYMPIIEQQSEGAFRVQLIRDLLADQGIEDISESDAQLLQDKFDSDRLDGFDFYPGVMDFLTEARKLFTLVVITNGPEFSQVPKVEAVNLADHVDHIIIGGQEPEQKPAVSIFEKALKLANCEPHEAIHIGDSLKADVAGALNSGITAVWIQHQQPLDAELGINPDHTVMRPEEIPELIRNLHKS
jgi:HAD superfamily hydrolase (TIGR01509 family)